MTADPKPDTWMPLVIGDYLKDTTRLNTEQHGAYLLLIMGYWVDGPPHDDDEELSSITKLDLRTWRRHRAKIAAFFRIEDGFWKHKRVEEELERWARKKAIYIERAAAGGRAKAAKSTPQAGPKQEFSTGKGCLEAAPQPASTEVEANKEASTLSGRFADDAHADGAPPPCAWTGPAHIRQAFCDALGDAWCRKVLDHCGWQDVPERALITPYAVVSAKLVKNGRDVLAKLGLQVLERAA